MSRTIIKVPYSDYQKTNDMIQMILREKRFKEKIQDGRAYWQKGGFWAAPQCVQVDFSETEVTISAWVLQFGAESDLTGIVAIAAKKPLLELLEILKYKIH